MIWNSIPFMTAVDVLIVAVTVYAIWSSRLIGPQQTTVGAENRPSVDRLRTARSLSVLFC